MFFTYVILLLTSQSLYALNRAESVLQFSDIEDDVRLDEYVFLLQDTSRSLSISDVQTREFKPNNKSYINLGYNTYADWMKFTICNTGFSERTFLKIDKLLIDNIRLYRDEQHVARPDSLLTYHEISPVRKSSLSSSIYFPINIAINDTVTFYLRCVSVYGKTFSLSVIDTNLIHQGDTRHFLFIGLYIGMLMIMVLYNLFLGYSIRDPLYFHYALAGTFALLGGISVKGFIGNILPDEYVHLVPVITASLIGLYVPFSCNFNVRILDLRKNNRTVYYAMIGIAAISVIGIITIHLLRYFGIPAHYSIVSLGALIFCLISIIAGIVVYKKVTMYIRFYLVGWFSVFTGLALLALTLLGYLPKNMFTLNIYSIGIAMEVISLSFALAERYNSIQKKNTKLELDLQYKTSDITKVVTDNKLRHDFKLSLLNQLKLINNKKPEAMKKDLNSFLSDLTIQIKSDERRNILQEKIETINTEFESKLKERFPKLTKNEIEICSYLKLNLSMKEIAAIRNTSVKTISMAKYRINKKMQETGSTIDEAIS